MVSYSEPYFVTSSPFGSALLAGRFQLWLVTQGKCSWSLSICREKIDKNIFHRYISKQAF